MFFDSNVSGRRVARGVRRRSFRRRAACFVAAAVVIVYQAAAPAPANAAWVAMISKVFAEIREAIDIWEKHTRQFEDYMDQAAGMVQPFTDLHAGYKELTDLRGLRSLARLGDAYRSQIVGGDCFSMDSVTGGRDCQILREFVPSDIRTIDDGAAAMFGTAVGIVGGFRLPELEAVLRAGLEREGGVGGGGILGGDHQVPGRVRDVFDSFEELKRTNARVQYNKARLYANLNRSRGFAARYEHLAHDLLRIKGGSEDVRAGRTPDGALDNCEGGGGALGFVGPGATDSTLLAQVQALDCAGGVDAGGDPHSPLTPGAHQSPAELATVQANLGVWRLQAAANSLADEAELLSNRIHSREVMVETSRRAAARSLQRIDCPHAPTFVVCPPEPTLSAEELAASEIAFAGVGRLASDLYSSGP